MPHEMWDFVNLLMHTQHFFICGHFHVTFNLRETFESIRALDCLELITNIKRHRCDYVDSEMKTFDLYIYT